MIAIQPTKPRPRRNADAPTRRPIRTPEQLAELLAKREEERIKEALQSAALKQCPSVFMYGSRLVRLHAKAAK